MCNLNLKLGERDQNLDKYDGNHRNCSGNKANFANLFNKQSPFTVFF